MSLMKLGAVALAQKIKAGGASCREALEESLAAIQRHDSFLHAFLTVRPRAELLKEAEEIDRRIVSGELSSPLAGTIAALKDNLCMKGVRTTCASRMLMDYIPPYSADAVMRLYEAGVLVIGKTNMDEFAMGSTTETSCFGVTRNPVNTDYTPGGSSGGSAAAVAAELISFALGSDTGGSIRQPASHCGIFGLKPTYGSISRYGLIAYASSMDQIGPMTRTSEDAAAVLSVLMGKSERDMTSRSRTGAPSPSDSVPISGLRIGIPRLDSDLAPAPEIEAMVRLAAKSLKERGAQISETPLPLADYAVPAYYTIASAEAYSNLSRYDGIRYGLSLNENLNLEHLYEKTRELGFGEEVKRRLSAGSFVLQKGFYDDFYRKAIMLRSLLQKEYKKLFSNHDLILMPVAKSTAPLLGSSLSDPLRMYAADLFTVPANLAGLPAISVPYGADAKGLPIGIQLVADRYREDLLLSVSRVL